MSNPIIQLDLSKQRLFIHPDAPLPRFNPKPKAVMVTPIYDYDGPLPPPPLGTSSRSGSRDARDDVYTYAFNAAQDALNRRTHGRTGRRYSSHSPGSYRRDSVSPVSYSVPYGKDGRYSYSGPSGYAPSGQSGYSQSYAEDRARPPDDPIAQNPPDYQIQATQGYSPSQSHQSYSGRPYSDDRARPSHDPIAQNPPDYQVQATQGHGGYSPSQGRPASGRPAPPSTPGSLASIPIVSSPPEKYRPSRQSKFFEKLIQDYLKVIPLNPEYTSSRCTRRKRALCIGINYVGQKDELRGCANDARHMRDFLIQQYNFPPSEILVMTDDDPRNPLPTRKEMFQAFMWLVRDAGRDDSLFFHYSGHGGQTPDASGREADGMDEVIYPVDYHEIPSGHIIDDAVFDVSSKLSCDRALVAERELVMSLRNSPRDDEKAADTFRGTNKKLGKQH
ncbi:metacaspase-1 [Coprinopsis cinerea okayama7|uniref:Metacaspase-1 n=1 Tax=Coprinopsis cinerea (strain Okayama-7 / 130 / ATCC MYA-4618 / FGSC 9003) TaxID=240176 RepID=A8NHU6_COPC7|nr:metacaspase-1 [Coprinopsis cinerea okayama7\|eukprot:XP_001833831.2 metacaspase-1 [Coprinopsis cinerea okayama7\